MKKILLGAAAISLSVGVNAQTYFSDDFSAGNLNNWTLVDGDGDNNNWLAVTYSPDFGQGGVATSASWNPSSGTPAGPLNPDNWMISQAIDLTSATGNVQLRWKVRAQDQSWPAEKYSVYVATASDTTTLKASTTTFNETITTSPGYMEKELDVSSFIGQTIYVAFRHHDVSDQYRMNLDDVFVKTVPPYDISMVGVTSPSIVTAGNIDITGTVKNEGLNDITSIDVSWDNGGVANTETFAVNITPGQTFDFTHGTQLAVVAGQSYNLTVSVTTAGDGNPLNDSTQHAITGLSFMPTRAVVVEEGTGTWCGYCPRGAVAMEAMYNDAARDKFIGIAVHNSDPMTVSAYDAGASFSGFPGMNVNRHFLGEGVSTSSMQNFYDQAAAIPTVADISLDNIVYDWVSRDWNMDVNVHWAGNVSDDHRIAIVVVEDGVTGTATGYAQANYYHGGSTPLSGAGIADWTTAGNPVPATDMVYDHVGRELIGGYSGIAGSLTTPASAGDQVTYAASGTLNSGWKAEKVKLVAMIIKQSNGEIVNATETQWSLASIEEATIQNVAIYPNPATDVLNVSFDANNTDYTISLTDLSGRTMATNTFASLSGTQSLALPLIDLASGNYILTISSEEGTYTQKVAIK